MKARYHLALGALVTAGSMGFIGLNTSRIPDKPKVMYEVRAAENALYDLHSIHENKHYYTNDGLDAKLLADDIFSQEISTIESDIAKMKSSEEYVTYLERADGIKNLNTYVLPVAIVGLLYLFCRSVGSAVERSRRK